MAQQFTVSEGSLTSTRQSLTWLSTLWNVHHGVQCAPPHIGFKSGSLN
jgi:hypothetical protein